MGFIPHRRLQMFLSRPLGTAQQALILNGNLQSLFRDYDFWLNIIEPHRPLRQEGR